jgi:eukaryotic-like serine/threonine-protein kinase
VADDYAHLVERARRRVGTSLRRGKYALTGLLGVGAMGAVYEAVHRNGMRVAIKLLHEELSQSEVLRARFLREGYIANKVQHVALVRVLDDDVDDDGATFLVMELLKGSTLMTEWEAGGRVLPAGRVVEIASALLDVLEAVHAQGIVHRDIKPDNVFFTLERQLKLLDLGIARLLHEERMTVSGQMMGTAEFAAPEQAGGRIREIDGRTDLYSVGALMFMLLSGREVHEARTPMEGMIFAATRPARSLRDVWPGVPSALSQVVDVALCFEKERRWSSAAEMRIALGHASRFVIGLPPAPKPPPQGPQMGPMGTVIMESRPPPSAEPVPLVRPGRGR